MKKVFYVNFAKLLCFVGMTLALAACSKQSKSGDVSLDIYYYGSQSDKKIYDDVFDKFKEENPNVKITANFVALTNWGEYIQNLAIKVASGDIPDIVNIATEGVALAAEKKILMPFTDLLKTEYGKSLLNDIHPTLIGSVSFGGVPYMIPVAWNNILIFYNKKMFREMGIPFPKEDWTWSDFLDTAKKLSGGKGENKTFGVGLGQGNFLYSPFFFTNNTSFLSDDMTSANFDTPEFIESLSFMKELVDSNAMPIPSSIDGGALFELFTDGRVGMLVAGHWPIEYLSSHNFKDYDVVPFPKNKSRTTVLGVGGWGITQQSKNKEIAWELIKELVSEDTQKRQAVSGVAIPSRRSVAETPEFLLEPENAKIFYETLDYAKTVEAPIFYPDLDRILRRVVNVTLSGEKTPKEAAVEGQKEITGIINKLR